tara:strand:- start:4633 stop:4896 length:264 start_codon:yes stop_codon:yes gene_type:complete
MVEEVIQQNNPEEIAPQIIAESSTEQAEPVAVVQTDQQEAVIPAEPTLSDLQQNMQDFMGKEQGRQPRNLGSGLLLLHRLWMRSLIR